MGPGYLFLLSCLLHQGLVLSQRCLTNGGPNPGKPCKFPFIYKGVTYNWCPPDPKIASKTWCSTKTDSRNHHVQLHNEYGFCNSHCPTHDQGHTITIVKEQGQVTKTVTTHHSTSQSSSSRVDCKTKSGPAGRGVPCIFPFTYKNVRYTGCPKDLDEPLETWCSTKVDSRGHHVTGQGAYGLCDNNCPKHQETSSSNHNVRTTCPGSAICRPVVVCASQFNVEEQRENVCRQSDGSTGLCCPEVKKNVGNGFIDNSKKGFGIRQDTGFVPNSIVSRAADVGESFASNVTRLNLRTIRTGTSPEFRHSQNQRQSPGVARLGRIAFASMVAAKELRTRQGSANRVEESVAFTGANTADTVLETTCRRPIECDPHDPFRTIDGSCNNLNNPKYGMSFTPVQRILDNAYADGLALPRVDSVGNDLPSTRQVSVIATGSKINESPNFTAMLVAFGQFLDHDLDHIPISQNEDGEPIECCEGGEFVDPKTLPLEERVLCFPIEIPKNDPFFGGRKECINLVRSVASPRLDCSPGPLEQINQITSWLDSSNVYGSLDDVANSLREFRGGLLRAIIGKDGKEQLPIDPNAACIGPTGQCGLAGDLRPNEQPTLGTMHVLFLREHNRLARILASLNSNWDDEKLFQESRRILNAEWQHIVYNEWLPVVLGSDFLKSFGLRPLTEGFSRDYNDDFDPRVTNEFATAAFRIGHTLIPTVIRAFSLVKRTIDRHIDLQDVFSDGDIIREPDLADKIIRGLTIQPTESVDNNFSEDVTENLFDDGEFGIDLIAINMQRGRDHGLQPYVKYREICGVGKATSFEDLESNIPPERIALLKRAYKRVEDIDLFIGMTQELPTEGDSLVGSTFLCLIGDVFARVKIGDRFFYDLEGQAGSFTLAQLDQIRRTSLSRIICDNTDIEEIQPLSFRLAHEESNPLTRCKSNLFLRGIPRVDLKVFKE